MRRRWGKRKNCENFLKEKGFRITHPRRLILDILQESRGTHPNAKEIYSRISKEYPDIGLTTIYRTLDVFEKLGLINKFEFGGKESRYEFASEENHHHHLVCLHCGKVIEYADFADHEVEFFGNIQKYLSKKYEFEISKHRVVFYGLCSSCKGKKQV